MVRRYHGLDRAGEVDEVSQGWAILVDVDESLSDDEFAASLGRALDVRFAADGVAFSDKASFAFEPNDIFPGYRNVLDVYADDPETAARVAYASLRRAYPDWRIVIDLPDLGQMPKQAAKAS